MGNFKITQSPASKNIFLYPNSNGCITECFAFGSAPNFECVNDAWDALEPETDYVWMEGETTCSELYAMENHTTETGAINYVKAYDKAKSDKYAPHVDAVYKVAIANGTTMGYTTLTLRPNAVGAFEQWQPFPDTGESNYEDVDEAVCDNGTTTVQSVTNGHKDYYNITDHTTESGTITKVEVFICFNSSADTTCSLVIYDTGTTNRQIYTLTCLTVSGWNSQSHEFATNPDGGTWDWDDIDALQIGIEYLAGGLLYVSQMYVEVTYESGYVCDKFATSDNMPLCTGYGLFGYAWRENPWTDANWTWDEIDDMQVGFECSSPSVIITPFPILPIDDGDRTDITDVTTGYEHWEAIKKSQPYSEVFETGAAWKYDLYKFIQQGADYYPADNERDLVAFTYKNKNYVLLCSSANGLWLYEWTGEYLKYITKDTTTLTSFLYATYDGTYFYVGGTTALTSVIVAYSFDGETLVEVGTRYDSGVNNTTAITINGTVDSNDGYIYFIGAGNDLEVLSFDGSTFTQYDTIASGATTYIYGDGTYIHANAHAYSFDGTTITDICAGGNDEIRAGDGVYLYAMDEVAFASFIVAYTFNGAAYVEVARLNIGGLGALLDICCDNTYIYASVSTDLKAYLFDGATFTEEGSETFATFKNCVVTNGKFIYTLEFGDATNPVATVYSFNGENFKELINVANGTTPKYITDDILSITVVAKMGKDPSADDQADIRGCFTIKTGGNEFDTSADYYTLESKQRYYAYTWTENPDTAAAWTLAEVQALQAGIGLYGDGTHYATCSRCYIVIGATTNVSPEIKTCQSYLKVNYTPDDTVCYLPKPQQVSTNHARNVQMLNFWNGEREVYDVNRSGKSMVLTGEITDGNPDVTNACDQIMCVRDMARDGTTITISGLNPVYFNGEYRINSFGWRKIGEKPENYEWILDLESAS